MRFFHSGWQESELFTTLFCSEDCCFSSFQVVLLKSWSFPPRLIGTRVDTRGEMSANVQNTLTVQLCLLVLCSANPPCYSGFPGLAAPSVQLGETSGCHLDGPSWKPATLVQSHGSPLISPLSRIAIFHCLMPHVLEI